MNLLEEIIAYKKKEIEKRKEKISLDDLIRSELFDAPRKSLKKSLLDGNGIIAEFKRKSPSAGDLSNGMDLTEVVKYYQSNNVSGFSVLTDENYFGGTIDDLTTVKNLNAGPILRKDFIIDEYQIFEAKANGADVVLLIAEALDEYHTTYLATIAKSIGLEVLMEFHSGEELYKLNENVDVVGINNRNLKTLKTDLRTSFDLIKKLPYEQTKIVESGISSAYEIEELLKIGYNGFLIGESVLKNKGLLEKLVEAANRTKAVKS